MNTKSNALRAVEEIHDELEAADRAYAQTEKERDEIDAKLQHARDVLAEVEAVKAGPDFRLVTDDLLDRGAKAERGIAALQDMRARAEERRIEAAERCAVIRRTRAEEAARVTAIEDAKMVEAATKTLEDAATAFLKAVDARAGVVEAVEARNAQARALGVPVAPPLMNREVLRRLVPATGVRIDLSPAGVTQIVG